MSSRGTETEASPAVRRADGQVHVDAPAMERFVGAIFERAGCDAEEARRIAWRLTGANLRGHDSHGVLRTRRYLEWMEADKVRPGQRITVERETEAIAIVDGGYGFGQTVGEQTVDLGVEKARRHGVAVTALKNAGHLGRIGDWAERAAEANCASIHMVNVRGSLIVAPFGAIERRGSTSPFCAGVPRPGEPPIIHDFATSVVAEGKAMVALHGGKPLPADALVDADGSYTSDPRPLYGETPEGRTPDPHAGPGALAAFGLHKGSGLNFFMEMFGGALTGSGTAAALGDTGKRRFCNGMFSIYMQVGAFHSDDWFAREVSAYVDYWKAARPAPPGGEVLVPGEKERMTMAERTKSGLPLSEGVWEDILKAARKVGMSDREVKAALAGQV
ncbi:MAG: Ldh family oxidoreductase [Thiotrichales bacterium]|nr:Ldh family oxidoreductase [Thiotrichales bacterium]